MSTPSDQNDQSYNIDTETTPETTIESAAATPADSAAPPSKRRRSTPKTLDSIPHLNAVIAFRAFGVKRDEVITGQTMTRINRIAKELRERWENGHTVTADELKEAFLWHTSGRGDSRAKLDAPRDPVKVAAMVAEYRDAHGGSPKPPTDPDCPTCGGKGYLNTLAADGWTTARTDCPTCRVGKAVAP